MYYNFLIFIKNTQSETVASTSRHHDRAIDFEDGGVEVL